MVSFEAYPSSSTTNLIVSLMDPPYMVPLNLLTSNSPNDDNNPAPYALILSPSLHNPNSAVNQYNYKNVTSNSSHSISFENSL